jgi:hypothetical protein
MKHLKPNFKLYLIKSILFSFVVCSTSVIAHFNCALTNANCKVLDTIQTVNSYQNDPIKPLNQEMLLNLSKGNELASIFNTLPFEALSDKRNVIVTYSSANLTLKLEGKLLCVSDKGVFVYSGNTLTFLPYKLIKFINRGLKFVKQIGIAVAAGGGIGFVYGLTETWPVIMGIVYGVYGAAVGGFYYLVIGGPINLIVSASPNFKFKILFDEENGKSYFKMINENNSFYGKRMQIKDYPEALKTNNSDTIIPQNEKDTIILAQESFKNLDSNKNSTTIAETAQSTPTQQLKVEFPMLNNPSGKINPTWMYLSFNKLDVNEKKLMAKFKNIQGIQMIAENLQNLNPSEIQFLAITIATLNGFDFKNVAVFSESQSQYLKNYASYISNEVKPDSEIDPSNIPELDINNINLIYSVLKAKMN